MYPILSVILSLSGCHRAFLPTGPCQDRFDGPAIASCTVPGWEDRAYDIVLPDDYAPGRPVPLLLALHGGGGSKEGAARTTCSEGEVDDASCLHRHAQDNGYALVLPNGSGGGLFPELRTWNAGGGVDGWTCVSGQACEDGVDDVGFISDLLDDVAGRVDVDAGRVYASGLSNGGAMSHRLACELSERIVAIAAVGGAMQLTTSDPCAPTRPVAILQVHGTEDPCWTYDGSDGGCLLGTQDRAYVPVSRTLDEWSALLGCTGQAPDQALPDTRQDGTTTVRQAWTGCAAPLEHLRVDGGGHAWPDGFAYYPESSIGRVPRDWGNEELWDFLSAQVRD